MDDKYPLDKLLKHPLAIVTYAAVVVVILYYMMSPYQKCMRVQENPPYDLAKRQASDFCIRNSGNSSW